MARNTVVRVSYWAIGLIVAAAIAAGFFVWAARVTPADLKIESDLVTTGGWTSTCSGGIRAGSCTDGVLEVTLTNGDRVHIPWTAGTPIPPTMFVESFNDGPLLPAGAQDYPTPSQEASDTAFSLRFFGTIIGFIAFLGFVFASFVHEESLERNRQQSARAAIYA